MGNPWDEVEGRGEAAGAAWHQARTNGDLQEPSVDNTGEHLKVVREYLPPPLVSSWSGLGEARMEWESEGGMDSDNDAVEAWSGPYDEQPVERRLKRADLQTVGGRDDMSRMSPGGGVGEGGEQISSSGRRWFVKQN